MHLPLDVLGAMITPAVLISAAALLLLSTASRLGRVNDRLLHLTAEAERVAGDSSQKRFAEKVELLLSQLSSLKERLSLLRSAVTALYGTIALLIVTSIAGGIYALWPWLTSAVPSSVGMLAALAFLYSIFLLFREASLATQVTHEEIRYAQSLLTRNGDDPSTT